MKIKLLKSALALAVAASPALFAAQIEDEVVVTATRSPYSLGRVPLRVRVIDAEDIALSAARTVEEALRGEGSLQVRDSVGNGRDVRISVRGLSAGQNALILLDGRRLNNSDLSEPDLTAIALKDVERIEVLEGGAGVLFGDQAVGGVVNVITRRGGERGGRLAVGVGSYDARNIQLGYGGSALDERLDYRVSAQKDDSEGYRDETDIDYGHARAETGYRYGDGRVFAEVQRSDNDYLLPGALLDFQLADDRRQAGSSFNDYTIDASLYRVGVDHQFGEAVTLLGSYGRRDEDVAITGRSLSFGDSQTLQSRVADTLDPRLVLNLGDWRVTVGTDLEDYDYELAVNSLFGLSQSEHRHERRSEYLQAIYSPLEALQLSAGIRHARVDVAVDGGWFQADYDDSVTVKQLGLSYRLADNLRVYANRDETFRFALADENVDFMGNVVALKPQQGVAWELGGEWQLADLGLNLVLFDHAIDHEIGYDTGTFANVNFDDTRRRGATLDAAWQVLEPLELRASLTRMSAEFEAGDLDGNRTPGVAEALAKVALSYRLADNVRLYAEGIHTGSVAVDLAGNADELGGYTVYNLAASYEWRELLLRARLNNIFGKEYTELVTFFGMPAYYPSPKENASLSVEYRF
ncbi:MAG: TonB-dependent receptor [Porticoccaceae bacterium]|jgi:iron complex outermembrane receptor protein|nr:TonB-dependent receptor [Porticoccaceae bacterium]